MAAEEGGERHDGDQNDEESEEPSAAPAPSGGSGQAALTEDADPAPGPSSKGSKRSKADEDGKEELEGEAAAVELPHVSPRREVTTLGIPNSFRSELYFLIAEFLSTDEATSGSAAALREELSSASKALLQPRYDWTGKPHPKTYSDVGAEMAQLKLPSDHLLKLCFRLSGSRDASAGTRTLLGRPRED